MKPLIDSGRIATAAPCISSCMYTEVAGFLQVSVPTAKRILHALRASLENKMLDMVKQALTGNALPEHFQRTIVAAIA